MIYKRSGFVLLLIDETDKKQSEIDIEFSSFKDDLNIILFYWQQCFKIIYNNNGGTKCKKE
jgi:hypothetical protein